MQIMRILFTTILLAASPLLVGCASTSDKDLVYVNTTEAKEVVAGKPKLLGFGGADEGTWIDSRSEQDFIQGHIPGAVSLPFEHVTEDHAKLKKYKILIVYGEDYNDNRADAMSKRLITLGHRDVRTLTGGMRAWKSDGNAIETKQ